MPAHLLAQLFNTYPSISIHPLCLHVYMDIFNKLSLQVYTPQVAKHASRIHPLMLPPQKRATNYNECKLPKAF